MTSLATHRRTRTRVSLPSAARAAVRVVAYCRRSVEKDAVAFGSIEAQREAIASYVASQAEKGWTLNPHRYEDRNLSGATTDRPALRQLLADAEAGQFDVVCLYKFDRISRSLLDFVQLVRRLEGMGITVVSVTQQIDTSTTTGRLMLNILASFAEFEREQIAERIGDKMLAARRRGQWQGGRPVLGYDVVDKKLVANEREAADVRAAFDTFLRTRSLVGTLRELERSSIRLKSWTTKRGRRVEGQPFDAKSLRTLLTNPLYEGKIAAGDEVVDGQHEGIVPPETFDAAQAVFAVSQVEPGRQERQPWSALLTGVFKCGACGSSMVPTYSVKGTRRFGYYQCQRTKSHGAAACPGARVAQGRVEAAVIEKIMAIGRDAQLVAEAVQAAHADAAAQRDLRAQDVRRADAEVGRLARERDELVTAVARIGADVPELRDRLDRLYGAHDAAAQHAAEARAALERVEASAIDETSIRRAIESFWPCWHELFPGERARLIHLLVERVVFDARTGEGAITLSPTGIAELASQGDEA